MTQSAMGIEEKADAKGNGEAVVESKIGQPVKADKKRTFALVLMRAK